VQGSIRWVVTGVGQAVGLANETASEKGGTGRCTHLDLKCSRQITVPLDWGELREHRWANVTETMIGTVLSFDAVEKLNSYSPPTGRKTRHLLTSANKLMIHPGGDMMQGPVATTFGWFLSDLLPT